MGKAIMNISFLKPSHVGEIRCGKGRLSKYMPYYHDIIIVTLETLIGFVVMVSSSTQSLLLAQFLQYKLSTN